MTGLQTSEGKEAGNANQTPPQTAVITHQVNLLLAILGMKYVTKSNDTTGTLSGHALNSSYSLQSSLLFLPAGTSDLISPLITISYVLKDRLGRGESQFCA